MAKPLPHTDIFSKLVSQNDRLCDWFAPEAATEGPLLTDALKAKLKQRELENANKSFANVSVSAAPEGDDEPAQEEDAMTVGTTLGGEGEDFFGFNKGSSTAEAVETHGTVQIEVKGRRKTKTVTKAVPLWSVKRYEQGSSYHRNPLVALHQEIQDFVEYMSPTEEEIFLRRHVEVEMERIAKSFWPESAVVVYGSMSTSLLHPLSDIDMTIVDVPVEVDTALTSICREVAKQGLCVDAWPTLILKTKVPLVKFEHKRLHVDVDISINAVDGKVNTEHVRDFLAKYPEARPLIIVVKCFLQQREMHEPFKGGMGSFAVTLLVISFLQNHPLMTGTDDRARCGLGKLLVDFFHYYSNCFNYHRAGVSLDNGGFYFIKPPNVQPTAQGRAPPAVLVQDPGNSANNATSSLRNFHQISTMFSTAWMALSADLPDSANPNPSSPFIGDRPTLLSRVINPDPQHVTRRNAMSAAHDELLATGAPDVLDEVVSRNPKEDEFLLAPQQWFRAQWAKEKGQKDKKERKRERDTGSAQTAQRTSGSGGQRYTVDEEDPHDTSKIVEIRRRRRVAQ